MGDPIKDLYQTLKTSGLFVDEADFRTQLKNSPKDVFSVANEGGLFTDYQDFETALQLKKKAAGPSLGSVVGQVVAGVAQNAGTAPASPSASSSVLPSFGDSQEVTINGVKLKTKPFNPVQAPTYEDANDPVKSFLEPGRQRLRSMAEQNRSAESTAQNPAKKKALTHEVNLLKGQEIAVRDGAFANGDDAGLYLQQALSKQAGADVTLEGKDLATIEAALPKHNETTRLAFDVYRDQKDVESALSGAHSLDEAAFNYAAAQDPHLKKQGEVMLESGQPFANAIPESQRGALLYSFLKNRHLTHLSEKNPELLSQIRGAQALLMQHYPDFGEMVVASKIAKWREQAGQNNGILNVVEKDETDRLLQSKMALGALSPQEYQLYKERIEPTLGFWQSLGRGIGNSIPGLNQAVNNAKIKTPGFLESTQEGLESTEVAIAQTFATPLRSAYKSEADQLFEAIDKEYSTPTFTPQGLVHQVSNYGGAVTGQMLLMGSGANALKAVGLVKTPAMGTAIMGGLMAYAPNKEEALKAFPGEPLKQHGFALGATLIDSMSEALFPNEVKAADALAAALKPKFKNIVQDFTAGKITAEAAKQSFTRHFAGEAMKFGAGTLKGANQEGVEEWAASMGQSGLKALFDGHDVDFTRAVDDAFQAYQQGFFGGSVLAGVAATSDIKRRKVVGESIWEMAGAPEAYKAKFQELAALSEEVAKETPEALQNLEYAAGVRKDLEATNLTEDQKKEYLLHSLNQKVLQERADATTDPTLKAKTEEQIKASKAVTDGLLAGKAAAEALKGKSAEEIRSAYVDEIVESQRRWYERHGHDFDEAGTREFFTDNFEDVLADRIEQQKSIVAFDEKWVNRKGVSKYLDMNRGKDKKAVAAEKAELARLEGIRDAYAQAQNRPAEQAPESSPTPEPQYSEADKLQIKADQIQEQANSLPESHLAQKQVLWAEAQRLREQADRLKQEEEAKRDKEATEQFYAAQQSPAAMDIDSRIRRFEEARDKATSQTGKEAHQRMIDKLQAQKNKKGAGEATTASTTVIRPEANKAAAVTTVAPKAAVSEKKAGAKVILPSANGGPQVVGKVQAPAEAGVSETSAPKVVLEKDERATEVRGDANHSSYDIKDAEGNKLGNISFNYREDLGGYQIENVKVNEGGKGVGTEVYRQLIAMLDKPLISDSSRTEAAEKLWKKLEREGLAQYNEAKGKYYSVKPESNQSPTTPAPAPAREVAGEGVSETQAITEGDTRSSGMPAQPVTTVSGNAASGMANRIRSSSASSVNFDRPIAGKNGNQLVGYVWESELLAEATDKKGEQRVSDWNKSGTNADTGRRIVHKFVVKTKDGQELTVSAGSLAKTLGLSDAEMSKAFPKGGDLLKAISKLRVEEQAVLSDMEDLQAKRQQAISEVEKDLGRNIEVDKDGEIADDAARHLVNEKMRAKGVYHSTQSHANAKRLREVRNRLKNKEEQLNQLLPTQQSPTTSTDNASQATRQPLEASPASPDPQGLAATSETASEGEGVGEKYPTFEDRAEEQLEAKVRFAEHFKLRAKGARAAMEAYMERIGLTPEAYQGLSDDEKAAADKAWRESPEYEAFHKGGGQRKGRRAIAYPCRRIR